MDRSLKSRSLVATAWAAGGNLGGQALRLASSLVLTRLLVPEAFGLVAAVNVLYFALALFSDLGVWQSVVRAGSDADHRFLGTAWSIQLLRGLLLAGAVLGLALVLALGAEAGWFGAQTVYADPRLPWMMAVFAICALIQGGESINLALAERRLQAGALARLELLTQFSAFLVTLALAFAWRSAWALLGGMVFSVLLRTVLSHILLPGVWVSPCWDGVSARQILGYGKWIWVSSVIGFLGGHGEKLILGASLSVASFGVFSIAATLVAAAVSVVSSINGRVIFPSLSEALRSSDSQAAPRVYTRVQQLADGLLGLLAGGLLMTGHRVVALLYDPRYAEAGWMLEYLSLGLLAMRQQILEQLMFARGQPGWVIVNNALRALGLLCLIPAGYATAGERGAILGVVASQFASWPLSLLFKYRLGLLSWSSERWWLPALAGGLALGWLVERLLATLFP